MFSLFFSQGHLVGPRNEPRHGRQRGGFGELPGRLLVRRRVRRVDADQRQPADHESGDVQVSGQLLVVVVQLYEVEHQMLVRQGEDLSKYD